MAEPWTPEKKLGEVTSPQIFFFPVLHHRHKTCDKTRFRLQDQMPSYSTLFLMRRKARSDNLAITLRKVAHHIFNSGGWVHACENHGIRQLPFRIFPGVVAENITRCTDARFVSLYYDAPVEAMQKLELVLRLDDNILRFCSLREMGVLEKIRDIKRSISRKDIDI